MGKRFVGVFFCSIAAILFSSRYIAAAIYMSDMPSRGDTLFSSGLEYVGPELCILSFLSLVCGIGYLIWAEISEKNKK